MYECEICGNSYEIEYIKEAEDCNGLGYLYCPYCGAIFYPPIIDNEFLTESR